MKKTMTSLLTVAVLCFGALCPVSASLPLTWLSPDMVPVGNTRMESYAMPGFSEGLLLVQSAQTGYYGYVNQAGNYSLAPTYLEAKPFSQGLAPVKLTSPTDYASLWFFQQTGYELEIVTPGQGAYYGFVNGFGNLVIPGMFLDAYSFSEGFAAVQLPSEYWGFVDLEGNLAIYSDYIWVGDFSQGYAIVQKKTGFGVIDSLGRVVVPCQFTDIVGGEGLYFLGQNGKYALADVSGQFHTGYEFTATGYFSQGLALVETEGSWGYVNALGQLVIPTVYSQGFHFQESLAWVRNQGVYEFVDSSGVVYLEGLSNYSQVTSFSQGYARVKKGIYYGFIDKTGAEVLPVVYRDGIPVSEGVGLVYDGTAWGLFFAEFHGDPWADSFLERGEALDLLSDSFYGSDLTAEMSRGEFTSLLLRVYDKLAKEQGLLSWAEDQGDSLLEEETEDTEDGDKIAETEVSADSDQKEAESGEELEEGSEEDTGLESWEELYAQQLAELEEIRLGFSPNYYTAPFTDTQNLDISRAYALGLVNGKSGTYFGAYDTVSRQEATVMLTGVFRHIVGIDSLGDTLIQNSFVDHDSIADWARESVYFLQQWQVVSGTDRQEFLPEKPMNGQEALVMAVNFVEKFSALLS